MNNRVPLVTMDRRVVGEGLSDVSVDSTSGMREAVKHPIELGHRKIEYIGGSAGPTVSDRRLHSFLLAMGGVGLPAEPQFLREGNYRVSGGETAMAELLQLPARPTAIIAANDLTAIGGPRVIHKGGSRFPGMSGSWDLTTLTRRYVYPPLTTLRLSRHELAKAFVNALEDAGKFPAPQRQAIQGGNLAGHQGIDGPGEKKGGFIPAGCKTQGIRT